MECIGREEDRENYKAIESRKANKTQYQNAIRFLSQCLETYYGRKPVVLIDEYDVPLENAFSRGYYDKIINFIRALFESGLKDNVRLEFAVITGCLRVSKESIFTGMNNLSIVSIRNAKFDEYFGFKENEVQQFVIIMVWIRSTVLSKNGMTDIPSGRWISITHGV